MNASVKDNVHNYYTCESVGGKKYKILNFEENLALGFTTYSKLKIYISNESTANFGSKTCARGN